MKLFNLSDIWGFNMPFSQQEIIDVITSEVEQLAGKSLPGPDAALFETGYLDSLNILHIIVFLESRFGLKIDPFAVNLEILGNVNKIAKFVQDNSQ
jgi:acyl carrier protein